MTTLPQTTQPRVPRPMGSGGLAVAGHGANAAPPVPTGMTAGDVWRVIRANVWLSVALVILGLIIGYVINWYLAKNYSRYTATGYVDIANQQLSGGMFDAGGVRYGLDTSTLAIEQKSQARSLSTDSLFNSILINRPAVRETTWFKQFLRPGPNGVMVPDLASAREDLANKISILPIQDTKLIVVEFTYSVPQDCATIINELVDEHLQQQGKAFQENNTARLQDLTSTLGSLRLNQNSLQDEITTLQKDLTDQGISSTSHFSPRDMKLANLSDQQRELQREFTRYKSALDALKDGLAKGEDPPEVDEAVDRDPHLDSLHRAVDEAQSVVTAMASLGENNPRFRSAQAELAQREHDLEDNEALIRGKQRTILLGKATLDYNTANASLQQVNADLESQRLTMGELDLKMFNLLTKQDNIKTINGQVEIVTKQLREIENENKGRDRTILEWSNRPEKPDTPSFPILHWSLSFGAFAGLMISVAIAFGREMLDQTVRSPRDISRIGQMTLLGMIPHEDDDPQVAGVPLPLVIFKAPTSIIAEQYRQVRTRLQQAAALDTTRSILVTSPSPGDGKSVVASNLAAGLALNGRRILLVDANFRRPQLNKIFDIGNEFGFSNVLGSPDNFETAVKQTIVPNLDVLPTGPKPANPTELMESQLLTDFIEKALEEYDHVIFDSGPLLFVSETVALAPRVDGVVTVVRARSNSRGLLQRMRDALRQLKAEHLGVVLNAVRAQGGGYYGRNIKTYYEYQNGHAS